VCAFYDALNDYQQEQTPDIDHFLREWENSIHEKTIQSDDVNGVRILTIHKSKGLEFDHVIVPFCDWDITGRDTLWSSPKEEPYSKMPLVPVDFSRPKMMGSIYEKDYVEESVQSVVDNMNLLYVAFTRAGKNLFVYGMRGNTDSHRDFIIEQSLDCLRDMLPDSKLKGVEGDVKEEALAFSYGSLALSDEVDKENTQNVFELPVKKRYVNIQSFKNIVDFRQSNKSTEFVESEDEEAMQRMSYINEGNVMHTIFSTINTIEDVDRVLSDMETEGILYDDSIDPEKLRTDLKRKFDNPIVKDWFSGRWKLFNECTILHIDPVSNELVERRPDRVMTDGNEMVVVDFKFGNMHPEYFDQVRVYMYLLQKMGHKNVKGYLWFVKNNKIEEVK
jgi:ATP-dependent exoDNAse (exonuclease V) beta subunit